jgi:hypothetical protein
LPCSQLSKKFRQGLLCSNALAFFTGASRYRSRCRFLQMPTIYTSIPLPAPHKLWFSAESNRHYAYSCMYTLCPSLNFSQLAALSFSVSFRFGLPLPPDRHDLLISGDDASTIQRLVLVFLCSSRPILSYSVFTRGMTLF